jgi:hypothetical protein
MRSTLAALPVHFPASGALLVKAHQEYVLATQMDNDLYFLELFQAINDF